MSWINSFVLMDKVVVEGSGKKVESSRKEAVSKKRARKGLDEESVKRQKLEDDAEKEELRACLEIVQHDDSAIIISDGSTKYYKIFSAMLDDFDRRDMLDLYRLEYTLISWRLYDSCGIHLLLMDTGMSIHMLVEKEYPLTQEILLRMLSGRLKVDHECEMAYELIRFIKLQYKKIKRLLSANEVTAASYEVTTADYGFYCCQNQRDLPKDTLIDRLEVLRYDIGKRTKLRTRIMPTETELTLEQTQQGLVAFCLRTRCVLSQDSLRFISRLVAFCLKTRCILSQDSLRFVSRLVAFCLVFCLKTHCVLSQDSLRFVSRLAAFCLKTRRVLYQDSLRFLSRLVAFCLKTRCVLSQDSLRFVSGLVAFCLLIFVYRTSLRLAIPLQLIFHGEPDLPVPVPESFNEQTDKELTENDVKRMDTDDQAIQTILLGLLEDVYAAVDSCEIAKEIWERVRQMMNGSDIGEQEKKAKLFNE
nr:hypothetical protein [Tanacetum cinerariifolium]